MSQSLDELDRAARLLADRADLVRLAARRLQAAAATARWESLAAQAFRRRANDRHRKLLHCAQSLDHAAASLRRHAQAVRERQWQLRQEAARLFDHLPLGPLR